MKKIVAVLLSALLALSLFACASSSGGASPAASASPSPAGSPGAEPSESGPVGYITDMVDYSARQPYKVEFVYGLTCGQTANFTDALSKLSKKINFTLTTFSSEMDLDKYVNELQTQIDQGINGFIFSPPVDVLVRQDEICREAGIPYINSLNAYTDAEGHTLAPTVSFNGYLAGANLTDWLVNNYKTYLKDADLSEIGYIVIDFSVSPEFSTRANGAKDEFVKLHPELEKNVYAVDLADLGFSIESGYTKTAATLAAHADIKYWFIFGVSEDFVVGAARAVEAAGKTADSILVSTGSDTCFDTWTSADNTPNWIATVPIYKTDFCAPMASGLVAMMDGRATMESLWAELRAPGDKATQYIVSVDVVTRDVYKDFIAKADAVMDLIP